MNDAIIDTVIVVLCVIFGLVVIYECGALLIKITREEWIAACAKEEPKEAPVDYQYADTEEDD